MIVLYSGCSLPGVALVFEWWIAQLRTTRLWRAAVVPALECFRGLGFRSIGFGGKTRNIPSDPTLR